MSGIIPFPVEASLHAVRVDRLYLSLVAVSAIIILVVFGLIFIFSIRYRASSSVKRGPLPAFFSREVEIGWTLATLLSFLGIYVWSTAARIADFDPPHGALNIRVEAKQWMWEFEHPGGAREIDVLHVPLGIPVRLSMTSQDVIHSFYVPAFRRKQDVLPDRITTLWFKASKLGNFPIRCAEYCGTDHSLMLGEVDVMAPEKYAAWAKGHADTTLPSEGATDFRQLGCEACHVGNIQRAPDLDGVYGSKVTLADGRTLTADENYLERSILNPRADIVKGYMPVMPSYRSVITPRETSALIAYLKSMRGTGK